MIGYPRLHLHTTGSTNDRARELAVAGAPHGTLVTAGEQTAGRGRQGRSWAAPAGSALLMSAVLRDPPPLLSLLAGVAVCDAIGAKAALKWPNDVVLAGSSGAPGTPPRKLGGILVEGRPQEGWAVVGIGLNVAVDPAALPADVRTSAASLELDPAAIEPLLAEILRALAVRLAQPVEQVLDAWRERDALRGRRVAWTQGVGGTALDLTEGLAEGIDGQGRLLVRGSDGVLAILDSGEVHLASGGRVGAG